MTEPSPSSKQDETTPAAHPSPPAGNESNPARQAKATVVDHLRAIHELQSTLLVEQRKDAVLRAGTLAVIELVGLECGVALINASPGRDAIRFGQRGGRGMAQHEIEVLARSLDKEILEVRSGKRPRVVLATDPSAGGSDSTGEPPGAVQARDLASVLILGIGAGGRRDGVMILGRRSPHAFTPEELALAELLVLQVSAHYERVHGRSEATRVQEESGAVTRILQERNRELEALIAIQSTVGLTFDSDRHMDAILNKAVEVTGHSGALIYLVDRDERGEEGLRCVRGVGDPAILERARLMFWRRGESPVGSVWESGDPIVQSDLDSGSSVHDSQMLLRAGYKRAMWLALRARGRSIGVLQLLGGVGSSYDPAEQQLSLTVADQVATTIHDGRLLSDMMRHNLELEQRTHGLQSELEGFEHQLQGIRGAIAAADGSGFGQARLEGFLPGVVALLEAEAGAVYLQEAGSKDLRLRFQHGYPPDQHAGLEGEQPFLREAASRSDASVVNLVDGECPEGTAWMERAGYRTLTAIPFRTHDGARGLIAAAGCQERPRDERRPLHEVVASLAGLVTDDESKPAQPVATPADRSHPRTETVDAPDLQAQLVQAQKMESIGTLAGGIAHHFNNILACIMGYASHIKSLVPPTDPIHEKATIIEKQSERAAELTNQLRSFARGGEGRREPVDLNILLRDTVSFLSKSIDPSIKLDIACAANLPAVVADPGLIRQALLNLAINARDAMPEGGRITFETRLDHLEPRTVGSIPGLEPGPYVVVELNDSGPGMPEGVVERACEPFFTTKPSGAGTGLGLSVAYGIVKSHGGHLALSSAPGVGTAVSIYLPATDLPVPAAEEEQPDAAAPSPPDRENAAASDIAQDAAGPNVPGPVQGESEMFETDATRGEAETTDVNESAEAGWEWSAQTGPEAEPKSAAFEAEPESAETVAGTAIGMATDSVTDAAREPAPGTAPDTMLDAAMERAPDTATGTATDMAPDTGTGTVGPDRAPRPGLRVMVVDDEESLLQMTTEILSDAGYEVCTAKDGVEALQLYRQHWGEVHLVILDMVMPRLGGLETFRRIRGMHREARILLYSGYDRNEQASQAIREGALGLLAKPFGKSELLQWVRKVLPED